MPILCTNCGDKFPDPQTFGVHLERHREVKPPVKDPRTGEVLSRPCLMGCGRHFVRPSEYREHNAFCDGSAPLWQPLAEAQRVVAEITAHNKRWVRQQRKEKLMAVKCDKCGKEFKDGRGLSGHKRGGTCGTDKAEKPVRKAPQRKAAWRPVKASLGSAVGDVLRKQAETEREKARDHEAKADKLEAMAADLDTLMTD